jgi:hypothetical protein
MKPGRPCARHLKGEQISFLVQTFPMNSLPRFTPLSLALALVGLALVSAGCTQVQVAPETRGEYKLGELQVFADRDFNRVYEAAKAGLKDAKLFTTQDDRKVIEAELRARDSSDTMIIVKIKEVGPQRTSVKIRYGVLTPSLPLAQQLYEAIKKRL